MGLASVLCLVLLAAGPRTVRGTKWAWFWFMGFAPLGLGVLAWLAVEHPWSPRVLESPAVETEAGPRRRTGWAGLGYGLLAAVVGCALFRTLVSI